MQMTCWSESRLMMKYQFVSEKRLGKTEMIFPGTGPTLVLFFTLLNSQGSPWRVPYITIVHIQGKYVKIRTTIIHAEIRLGI